MKETTYQHNRTKFYAKIILTVFNSKQVEKDEITTEKKFDRLIEIQLNKHGWYKVNV